MKACKAIAIKNGERIPVLHIYNSPNQEPFSVLLDDKLNIVLNVERIEIDSKTPIIEIEHYEYI